MALLARLQSAWAGTGPDMSPRACALALSVLVAAAALIQAVLFFTGLYALSSDESARALIAHRITFANVWDPLTWPPLTNIVNRLGLALHDDLFLTPRVLVSIAGLCTVLGTAFATHRLFGNRLMAVTAAALSILVPERLLLSVAPLSDIYGMALTVFAAGFLMTWLRHGRPADLLATSALLFFAAMARYELWFFNAVLGLYLAYRSLVRRDLPLASLALNGALLASFPIFWIVRADQYYGNLGIFSLAGAQFIEVFGRDYVKAFGSNVAADLTRDFLFYPVLVLGLAVTAFLARRVGVFRDWTLLIAAPFVILALDMALSFSVPMAAPFRVDGSWVLLLLPFTAFGLVFMAERMAVDRLRRYAVLALALWIAAIPFGLRAQILAKGHQVRGVLTREDLALGAYLRGLTAGGEQGILLDSLSSLDYLNVEVAANMPERFTLDVDADPIDTAQYVDARRTYAAAPDRTIFDRYLTDKFGLAGGIDREKLESRHIGYLVIQTPALIAALDRNAQVARRTAFGSWVVYALKSKPRGPAAASIG